MLLRLSAAVLGTFLLNLPLGYWRAHSRRLSLPWFLAVHLSIPLIVLARLKLGLGWSWQTFPFTIGALAGGQFLGGWLGQPRRRP